MIGVFDSGAGGLLTVGQIRELAPLADICFLADRENAPYGTKEPCEVARLAEENIRHLLSLGAERVLIACCTACSVFDRLPCELRETAIPIIAPTARQAAGATKSGRIAVIATKTTVSSHAFLYELEKFQGVFVKEFERQELVSITEAGITDRTAKDEQRELVRQVLRPEELADFDTLILGCTHFPNLKKTIASLVPWMSTVSSTEAGALAAAALCRGTGKIIYTSKIKKCGRSRKDKEILQPAP